MAHNFSDVTQEIDQVSPAIRLEEDLLTRYKEDNKALKDSINQLEQSLMATSSVAESAAVELQDFKMERVSEKDIAKRLLQTVDELEESLGLLENEKEQSLREVKHTYEESLEHLTNQVLAEQQENAKVLSQINELNELNIAANREKAVIEKRLIETLMEKEDLERKLVNSGDKQFVNTRINELEQELETAVTSLLDMEIRLESSTVVGSSIDEEELNALRAAKSELDLVRQQAEKDIQDMQTKVENSERMNLSLKKKILSMQTSANLSDIPVAPRLEPESKNSWWK